MQVSIYQQRIAALAERSPELCFTSLNHNLDGYWLQEAFRRVSKNSAPGVDGVTWDDYAQEMKGNVLNLRDRLRSGRYYAPPVKRTHIPKGGSDETRPIGMPTLEDKVAQRAVQMLLEPIYEADFLPCSYGFRPKRTAHQALNVLRDNIMDQRINYILDVDVRKYFDTLVHQHLRAFLDRRVRDGVVRRLIDKWLNAGVMEEGLLHYVEEGAPQGGVISPLLSNIYLHYVLDLWFETEVKPRMKGQVFLIRFADDFVIGFETRYDAERVFKVLPKRFEKYGLSIHPDKTRLVAFNRPRRSIDKRPSGTFAFLGFTHYWAKSRKGNWVVKRKTASSRLRRALHKMTEWIRKHRHRPIRYQHAKLSAKLRGHYQYYGIRGNYESLKAFYRKVCRTWKKWLQRRGGKRTAMSWARFSKLLEWLPLPKPKLAHVPKRV